MKTLRTPVSAGAAITRTPGIKNGSPHIAGTGVLVRTIARRHQAGLSPEEIAAKYRFLELSQIEAALAYYRANQDAIDAELASLDEEAQQLEAAAPTHRALSSIGSARNSTFALSSGVRYLSGLLICTLIWSVPFWRLASGAISAT